MRIRIYKIVSKESMFLTIRINPYAQKITDIFILIICVSYDRLADHYR
jgi:hypothetical protein